jgi:hypothetical protein
MGKEIETCVDFTISCNFSGLLKDDRIGRFDYSRNVDGVKKEFLILLDGIGQSLNAEVVNHGDIKYAGANVSVLQGVFRVPFSTLQTIEKKWKWKCGIEEGVKCYLKHGASEKLATGTVFDWFIELRANPLLVRDAEDGYQHEYSIRGTSICGNNLPDIKVYDTAELNYNKLVDTLGLKKHTPDSINIDNNRRDYIVLFDDTAATIVLAREVPSLEAFESEHNLKIIDRF